MEEMSVSQHLIILMHNVFKKLWINTMVFYSYRCRARVLYCHIYSICEYEYEYKYPCTGEDNKGPAPWGQTDNSLIRCCHGLSAPVLSLRILRLPSDSSTWQEGLLSLLLRGAASQ